MSFENQSIIRESIKSLKRIKTNLSLQINKNFIKIIPASTAIAF